MVEFVLRQGDLGGSGGFSGSQRLVEGVRGHQRLQKSRPAEYQAEVPVRWTHETPDSIFELRGRIDGVLMDMAGVLIEEIKTVRQSWSGQPDPLHWAQARIYAHLFCQEHGKSTCTIRLSYLSLETNKTTEFHEDAPAASLKEFFDRVTGEYLDWISEHQKWCRIRDASIHVLTFPFHQYRSGQRSLSVAVYRTIKSRGRLFAEAPTGIGKTISVLFPAIKAMGEGLIEKAFYCTAKTIGRAVAEKALDDLRTAGLRLRSVTLTARDKICFNEGHPCDLTTCPYALGYFDRIKSAMHAALATENLTRAEIEKFARLHQVCPFELSLDLSLWVDAIICDYNYVFDPAVSLKRYFDGEKHHYAILVDESHNLLDRARAMFSAELRQEDLHALKDQLGSALPSCARALGKLSSRLKSLTDAGGWEERPPMRIRKAAPEKIAPAMETFLEEAERWLARNESAPYREALLEGYFQVLAFQRILEQFNERYVAILDPRGGRLKLFCLDPSLLLRQAVEPSGPAIFFSATLRPINYYRESLGGEPLDAQIQLESPFPASHLAVLIQDQIPTRLRARAGSYEAVAENIAAFVKAKTGNYLVYFPSYAYLTEVIERVRPHLPGCQLEVQSSGMSEEKRAEFLSHFQGHGTHTLVAFAVLGGVFGEGIDLVGERLIGVVVAGVGLPQISLERDLIREHCQSGDRSGFDYAYTYPGINRVLQAAGRVIRSESDRGAILLIDDRYRQPSCRRLLPEWWQPITVRNEAQLQQALQKFWLGFNPPSL